jgi:hypothetical protein
MLYAALETQAVTTKTSKRAVVMLALRKFWGIKESK